MNSFAYACIGFLLLYFVHIPTVLAQQNISPYVTISGSPAQQGKYGPRNITVITPGSNSTTVTPANWQTALTNNSTGKIFVFEPGVYENFTIGTSLRQGNVFIGKSGAILDGKSQIHSINPNVNAGNPPPSDVQIINFTIRGYTGGPPIYYRTEVLGALNIGQGWRVIGNTFESNHTALLAGHNWYLIENAIIADNTFRNNYRLGTLNGKNYTFENNSISENGWNYPDTSDQANSLCWVGTTKFQTMLNGNTVSRSNTDKVSIKGNYVHHNRCHGIWLDVGAERHAIIQNSTQNNEEGGITLEISNNNYVYANISKNNGPSGWMYFGAQINSTDSSNNLIYGNLVEVSSGKQGLTINNSSNAHPEQALNNVIKGNTVVYSGGISGLFNESGGTTGATGNVFDCNLYVSQDVQAKLFIWNGSKSFSDFQSVGQEPNGKIVTSISSDNRPTDCNPFISPDGYTTIATSPSVPNTVTPLPTGTFTPTPSSTVLPTRFPSFTPTPTSIQTQNIFSPPDWWNLLPEKLRNFLELLYIWTHYFNRQSDMKYLLDGIVPSSSPSPTP